MSTFSTNDSTVNSFYLAFYGRPADPAGLKFWSTQLAANNGDMGAIVDFFAASEEAQVRFGTDTVADRITEIYSQLFNRTPDAEGMAFWTNAIEQGHASLADIAMSIQGGAQGSDATLSQLRKQAADAFTAKVDADGTEYSGYASIEAARILVRAVTANATQADLDTLVNAAVSFADTATKTPQVVDAIAVNTTLLALFDTARGVSEPVALAKALADTAKAAAGDPVTLESLLRGGGMDKVLKVMPAKATLQDVVVALGEGGLPAAVDVVYPPSKPVVTPAPSTPMTLSFAGVAQDDLDTNKLDTVTKKESPAVTFKYTGKDLGSNQHFEYTTNGTTWVRAGISEDRVHNTVTIDALDLTGGMPIRSSTQSDAKPGLVQPFADRAPDLVTRVVMRAVEGDKIIASSDFADIVYDSYVSTPTIRLVNDTAGVKVGSHDDLVTKDGAFEVLGLEAGTTVEYKHMVAQVVPTLPLPDQLPDLMRLDVQEGGVTGGQWSDLKPVAQEGINTIWVRQTDAAGNQSESKFTFTLDNTAPKAPTVKFAHEIDSSLGANSGMVLISGLEPVQGSGWEYSINNGGTWTFGGANGLGIAELDLAKLNVEQGALRVRQLDAAGNIGASSETKIFTISLGELTATATDKGISLDSTVAGVLSLVEGGKPVVTTELDGKVKEGTTLVGAQSNLVSGHLQVTADGAQPVVDKSGKLYSLATNGDDEIFGGQLVWGFDGDDKITGTDWDDTLYGGAGNDTLTGGLGADTLIGGANGDRIVLGKDGYVDTVVINPGDTLQWAANNPHWLTHAMDVISGAEVGDVIELGNVFTGDPLVGTTLLLGADRDQLAIVRGTHKDSTFLAGAGETATSYMIQWSDGEQVNNIILDDFGTTAPFLKIDAATGTMTLANRPHDETPEVPSQPETPPLVPATQSYLGADFYLANGPSTIDIYTTGGRLTELISADGFKVQDYSSGSAQPATAYDNASGKTTLQETYLNLKTTIDAGLYQMSWTDGTFKTANGMVKSNTVFFAGGKADNFFHAGFEVHQTFMVYGDTLRNDDEFRSQAFISDGQTDAVIRTSRGNDVVVDNGSKLTVVYDRIDNAGQDLIFGFDEQDVILLGADLSNKLDRNGSESIDWSLDGVVGEKTEGVVITIDESFSVGRQLDLEKTFEQINSAVNVESIGWRDQILILVNSRNDESSVLFVYENEFDNGLIDFHELSAFAVFANGAITDGNIELTGLPQEADVSI